MSCQIDCEIGVAMSGTRSSHLSRQCPQPDRQLLGEHRQNLPFGAGSAALSASDPVPDVVVTPITSRLPLLGDDGIDH